MELATEQIIQNCSYSDEPVTCSLWAECGVWVGMLVGWSVSTRTVGGNDTACRRDATADVICHSLLFIQ